MSGEILFLSHRIPFPPDRGDKIRSHHVLKALAEIAPVHVGTFGDDNRDMDAGAELASTANSNCLVRRNKPLPLAGAQALLEGNPVSLTAFHSRALAAYVAKVLRERPIAAIYVFSGQMGQYVPASFAGRVVCDLVDVDSAKFEAYAADGSGPMSWINAREGRLLRREEARLARRADLTLLVSDDEADLLRSRLDPGEAGYCDVRTLRNGIDSQFFDPAQARADPQLADCGAPRLIFTGQMDYPPNVAAATRAIDRIMPLIQARIPATTLHIVGRNPPEALRARHGRNGCHIWGGVPDMRAWLAGCDLALVPLEVARGVQNKVLEAMAMGLPVVLSTGAARGIGADDGRHLAVADGDSDLAERAIGLLLDRNKAENMGKEARRFVVDGLSWQATLGPLAAMVGLGRGALLDAA